MQNILDIVDPPFSGEVLFDLLPDVVFFIKNNQGKYLVVNKTLVERCRLKGKEELIGKTPTDVLDPLLGASFAAQDLAVIRSGQPILSQLELHMYRSNTVGWCLTSKFPLRKKDREIIGLVGISQDLRVPNIDADEFKQVSKAISFAERRLATPPDMEVLSGIAGMSRYQLDRRMKLVFGLSMGQWLLKTRIDQARHQLQCTDNSIASIAIQIGYADQSAFTRQFRRTTGVTPHEYRVKNRDFTG